MERTTRPECARLLWLLLKTLVCLRGMDALRSCVQLVAVGPRPEGATGVTADQPQREDATCLPATWHLEISQPEMATDPPSTEMACAGAKPRRVSTKWEALSLDTRRSRRRRLSLSTDAAAAAAVESRTSCSW